MGYKLQILRWTWAPFVTFEAVDDGLSSRVQRQNPHISDIQQVPQAKELAWNSN